MKPRRLQNVIADLIESGIVVGNAPIDAVPIGRGRLRVELGDTSAIDEFDKHSENSIKHFTQIVNQNRYSLMFCDGSVCQIKYVLHGEDILWHRFAYMPCLRPIDPALLAEDSEFATLIDGDPTTYPRRAMLRFEYDPDGAAADHPASHLHLNSGTCRIPLRAGLGLGAFLDFVISHFYRGFDRQVTAAFRSDFGTLMTITPAEQTQIHLNWIAHL